jgi:hypothetical protein
MAKLSMTAQWMAEHPDDEPCPTGHDNRYEAQRWRHARGIGHPANAHKCARYEAAMAAKRAALAQSIQQS